MEKWIAYGKIEIQIKMIERFEGGNRDIKVFFKDDNDSVWMLSFDHVWDFRYAIENAFIDRCFKIRMNYVEEHKSIYVVEDSDYIKYFENQVSGSVPVNELKHFLIFDKFDTGLEILANVEPTLSRPRRTSLSTAPRRRL